MISEKLIPLLESLPDAIAEAAEMREEVTLNYNAERTRIALQALSTPIFTDKGGLPRSAANDTERKLAVDSALTAALENKRTKLSRLSRQKKKADRALERLRQQFVAAQLIAKLNISEQRANRG